MEDSLWWLPGEGVAGGAGGAEDLKGEQQHAFSGWLPAGLASLLPWTWQEGQCWAPRSLVGVAGSSPIAIGKPAMILAPPPKEASQWQPQRRWGGWEEPALHKKGRKSLGPCPKVEGRRRKG